MAAHRMYSDDEKSSALAALAANQGDLKLTAKQLDIPRRTIENWSKGKVHQNVTKVGEEKKIDLADKLELVAHQLADAMPGKIQTAGLQQIATSCAIAIDKMRLLREQPTSITGQQLTDAERVARLAALYDRLRARGIGPANGNGHAALGAPAGAANSSVQ